MPFSIGSGDLEASRRHRPQASVTVCHGCDSPVPGVGEKRGRGHGNIVLMKNKILLGESEDHRILGCGLTLSHL